MTPKTQKMLKAANYLCISYRRGIRKGYKIEAETGFLIKDASISVTLSTPLRTPIPCNIEDYILDDTNVVSTHCQSIQTKGIKVEDKNYEKELIRSIAIITDVVSIEVKLDETSKSELSSFPDFRLSSRITCDACKVETLVLTKIPQTLYFTPVCCECKEKAKKHFFKLKTKNPM